MNNELDVLTMIKKRFFGKPGTAYDFAANDMSHLKEKARELEEQQKGMKKKVNAKAPHTLERFVSTCICF